MRISIVALCGATIIVVVCRRWALSLPRSVVCTYTSALPPARLVFECISNKMWVAFWVGFVGVCGDRAVVVVASVDECV